VTIPLADLLADDGLLVTLLDLLEEDDDDG